MLADSSCLEKDNGKIRRGRGIYQGKEVKVNWELILAPAARDFHVWLHPFTPAFKAVLCPFSSPHHFLSFITPSDQIPVAFLGSYPYVNFPNFKTFSQYNMVSQFVPLNSFSCVGIIEIHICCNFM